jgi:WD40 repeat protein
MPIPEGQRYLGAHHDGAWAVDFATDGRLLASGGGEGAVKLWDPATGEERARLTGHTGTIEAVAFSPDSTKLATAGGLRDGMVRLWDVHTGALCAVFGIKLPAHFDVLAKSVTFSPDGTMLAAGLRKEIDDHGLGGVVVLWDIALGQQLQKFEGIVSNRPVVAFTPDGKTLAITDKGVRLFEVSTGKERPALKREGAGAVVGLEISPDGKTLVAVEFLAIPTGRDLRQTVVLWDLATGRPAATFTLPYYVGRAHNMALSHDGRTLATAGADGFVRLWKLPTGTALASVQGPTDHIYAVCFSPDDQVLAFACDNGAVMLADVQQHLDQ